MNRRRLLAAAGAAAIARPALAQQAALVPAEMRLVIPFAAGGATDILARRVAQLLEPRGHKIVVENLTGGGSMVAMSRLAQSRPDGRTIGFASHGLLGQIAANEIPLRIEQFAPLVRVAVDPTIMITGARSRFRTLGDVVAAMRSATPPSVGAAGPAGGVGHLRLLGFTQEARGDATYVGYPGASRLANELIGGHLDLGLVKPNDVFGQIRSGELRVIAAFEEERVRQLPDVPTIREAGFVTHPFGRITIMTFAVAPAGIAPDMRAAITALLRQTVLSPAFQETADRDGFVADGITGAELDAAINETLSAIAGALQKART
jgi:tripartite-type tricarboxylate transporter receptor subunit TctC